MHQFSKQDLKKGNPTSVMAARQYRPLKHTAALMTECFHVDTRNSANEAAVTGQHTYHGVCARHGYMEGRLPLQSPHATPSILQDQSTHQDNS